MTQLTIQQAFDLALQHHQAGRLHDAEQLYRQILAHEPEHVDAIQNLGIIAQQVGRIDMAVELIRRVIVLRPNYAEAHSNLGNALKDLGRFDEAIVACRRAIALRPDLAEAYNNLGIALAGKGQLDEAIAACRRAIALRPGIPEAHNNLGIALAGKGQFAAAVDAYREALLLRSSYAEAHSNLGNVLREQGKLDEAIAAYGHAITLRPDSAEVHNNRGIALTDQGRLDEAIESYRRTLQLKPDHSEAHSNLILAMLYRSGDQAAAILAENRAWSEQHAAPLADKIKSPGNDRSSQRSLRIGYVSADFRRHPVGYFLRPLLRHHDRVNFQIHAYSNFRGGDDQTDRLKEHCDSWHEIVDLSDDEAAELIRRDAIDILVDLSAHTRGNRLLVFARKPAPIQVNYLAYPATTGLETIDYRLTDPFFDPPERNAANYTEKSIRLPRSYWCYEPPIAGLEIAPPPAAEAGFITFGSLNSFCKITPAVLQTWSNILLAAPDSRLLLHALPGSHRDRVRDKFAEHGIKPDRVDFIGWLSLSEYMGQYRKIDVALDSFPYAGGMTTCHALWMGVPVITLAGPTAIGRGGVSILSNIGVEDLIANSPRDYARLAVAQANDQPRMGNFRSTIRERMSRSPLMDGKQLAAGVENAYCEMWRAWCATGPLRG
jgi:protein O-GlcNAc transferase